MFKCLLFLSLFVALTHGKVVNFTIHNDVSDPVAESQKHVDLKFIVVHNNVSDSIPDVSDDDIVKPGFLEQLQEKAMDELGCCGPLVTTYSQQLNIAEGGKLSSKVFTMTLAGIKVALKKKLSPFNTMTRGTVNTIIDNIIPTDSQQLTKLLKMTNPSEWVAVIVERIRKIKDEAANKLITASTEAPSQDEIDKAKKEVADLKDNPDCECNTIIKQYQDKLAAANSNSIEGGIMSYALAGIKLGIKAELAEFNTITMGIVFDVIDMVIPIPDTIFDKVLGLSNIVGATAEVVNTALKSGVFNDVHPSQWLKQVTGGNMTMSKTKMLK